MSNSGPLNEADYERIVGNLELLKEAKDQIRLAKQAGLDVTSLEDQANEQQSQLLKIRQTYFPGR